MQDVFRQHPALVEEFKNTLSAPRFLRYSKAANGDDLAAIELYQWNAKLAQSLYIYTQAWEIALRNRLDGFLCWKYNTSWPYDERRAVRQFANQDKKKLREAIDRQERYREAKPAPRSAIIADLPAGFWVSLLSASYDIPFVWRHNIRRVFPHEATLGAKEAHAICERLLELRNRIAHHEPIFHLPLLGLHEQMRRIVTAMCRATAAYCDVTCSFQQVWSAKP